MGTTSAPSRTLSLTLEATNGDYKEIFKEIFKGIFKVETSTQNRIRVPSGTPIFFRVDVSTNGDICFFDRERLDLKELLWQQY